MKQKTIFRNSLSLQHSKSAKIIVDVICVAFIMLFIYAAVTKLLDYQKFKVTIGQSPILTSFSGIIAWVIPLAEIIIAIMLAFNRVRIIGLYASFSLMVLFTGYIVAILNFSDYVPCSCGGILEKMGWGQHLIFNIFFIILGIVGILLFNPLSSAQRKKSDLPIIA